MSVALKAVFLLSLLSVSMTASAAPKSSAPPKIVVRSRSLRFENGSSVANSMQISITIGEEFRSQELKRDPSDLRVSLLFALSDLVAYVHSKDQNSALNEATDLLIVRIVANKPSDKAFRSSIKKVDTLMRSLPTVEAQSSLRLMNELSEADAVIPKVSMAVVATSDRIEDRNLSIFLNDGQDLFDAVARRMNFEQQSKVIAPISKELNEAITLVRAVRPLADVQVSLRKLYDVIHSAETTLVEFVSTPEFSTTGPKLRDWVHGLGQVVGTASKFEIKAAQIPTRTDFVSSNPVKLGAFSLHELPSVATNYIAFVTGGSEGKLEIETEAARHALDQVKARLRNGEGSSKILNPAFLKDLLSLAKALATFDAQLLRLKRTAETQNQAMEYGIWLKRFEKTLQEGEEAQVE